MITDELYEGIKPEWEEATRDRIPSYIWRRRVDGEKVGWCSHCGAYLSADKYSEGLEGEFFTSKHNGRIYCPNCGISCVCKDEFRMKNYNTVNGDARMLFVDVVSKDFVRLRGYYIEIIYSDDQERPDLIFTEMVRYELRPGVAKQARRSYSDFFGLTNWKECKGISEPWAISNQGGLIWYDIVGLESLGETFLKYLPCGEFENREYPATPGYYGYRNSTNRIPWGKILSCAALYPMFELCVKFGFWDIINDLLCRNLKNAEYINWNATSPKKFFRKVPTADAKKIMQETDILDVLKFYRHISNNADKAIAYAHAFVFEHLIEESKKLGDNPKQVADYLMKQERGSNWLSTLRDYRRFAIELGRDITIPSIRFPKNLVQAHDEYFAATEALRKEREETRKSRMQLKYSEKREIYRRLYEYESGEYMAVVPMLLSDIRLEGQNQHHCVAGYIDRHADGKTIIIFIRKVMYPAIPLYTVEISPEGTLRQVQGYHNEYKNKPTPEANEFIANWLAEIAKRQAKENKKPKGKTA